MDSDDLYPIVIIQDRYNGTYAQGLWLAVAEADHDRLGQVLHEGPRGADMDAMAFWDDPPIWIAAGETPDKAVKALREKVASYSATACPKCGQDDFSDPETQTFVCVNSGYNNTPGSGPQHWHAGWLVCKKCGHTEWHSDTSA